MSEIETKIFTSETETRQRQAKAGLKTGLETRPGFKTPSMNYKLTNTTYLFKEFFHVFITLHINGNIIWPHIIILPITLQRSVMEININDQMPSLHKSEVNIDN